MAISRKPSIGRLSIPWKAIKQEVTEGATELIETVLRPRHVQPPKDDSLGYITDITTKWVGSTCYFVSTNRSPASETKFARLEYVGDGKFTLSFKGHMGWSQLYEGLTVDECMTVIRDDPWFQP
jgi:hypothetical protein